MNIKRNCRILLAAIALSSIANRIGAYNICNNTNTSILVIVVESEKKAQQCLNGMGWQGQCWNYETAQTISCKTFPPQPNTWLIPNPELDVFVRPKQYIALHKIMPEGSCGRYSWRDIEKNFERRDFSKLYFMVFERFKQKSAHRIRFLIAQYCNAKSTINFTGSTDTGWSLQEKQ